MVNGKMLKQGCVLLPVLCYININNLMTDVELQDIDDEKVGTLFDQYADDNILITEDECDS